MKIAQLLAVVLVTMAVGCGGTTSGGGGITQHRLTINQASWDESAGVLQGILQDTSSNPNAGGKFDDAQCSRPNSRAGNKGIIELRTSSGGSLLGGKPISALVELKIRAQRGVGNEPLYPNFAIDCNANGVFDVGIDALVGLASSQAGFKDFSTTTPDTVTYTIHDPVFAATASNACGVPLVYPLSGAVSLDSLPAGSTFVDEATDCSNPRGVKLGAVFIGFGTSVTTAKSSITIYDIGLTTN